jgi:hypothetical protein
MSRLWITGHGCRYGEARNSAKRVTAFIATHGNDAVIICARITRNVIDALMSCKAG